MSDSISDSISGGISGHMHSDKRTAQPAPAVHLHQIAYSPETLAAVEPGYALLNNLDNPRPDWYEYWPIRRFLRNEPLDDAAFYGFFSPRFRDKTLLTHAEVVRFVQTAAPPANVVLFSPHPISVAYFLSVFEQGNFYHPGLMALCSEVFNAMGEPVVLNDLVMDSRHMVYSNYFVARPAFWREWLRWTQAIFAMSEDPAHPLHARLNATANYTGGAQAKIFVIERIASLLLTTQPQWHTRSHNPYRHGWPTQELHHDTTAAMYADALKHAFREQGFPEYLHAFMLVRQEVIQKTSASR